MVLWQMSKNWKRERLLLSRKPYMSKRRRRLHCVVQVAKVSIDERAEISMTAV